MRRSTKGFTLIELMISVVLGLVIIGGVISVLLANKRSYRTNEGLGQIQESARTAFELMARDIRQAGGNGCDNNNRTANILNAGTLWWQEWYGMRGFESAEVDPAVAIGTTVGLRVAGTDSIQVQSMEARPLAIDSHDAPGAVMTLVDVPATPYVAGDALLVCDFDHAAIFQVTAYDNTAKTVTHDESASGPGNCTGGLAFPVDCDAANLYPYPQNAQISRLQATDWYIGNNDRPDEGGRSLYRIRLDAGGTSVTEEVVSGVIDMQVQYRVDGTNDIVDGSAALDWPRVTSIFITLTIDSADANISTEAAENSGRIQRPFTYLVTLRNRVQ